MSIVTKTGDDGSTALMYGRRVSKCHPRVEAYGALDELNAALGLARATSPAGNYAERLLAIQNDLVIVMGELATTSEDLPRYQKDGYSFVTNELTAKLDVWVKEIESAKANKKGWAMPGGNLHAAHLDLARTVCRRAERNVCRLQESNELRNPEIIVFLNRLSDLMWLLARCAE